MKFILMGICCVIHLITMTFRYSHNGPLWNVLTSVLAGASLISAFLLSINLAFHKDNK